MCVRGKKKRNRAKGDRHRVREKELSVVADRDQHSACRQSGCSDSSVLSKHGYEIGGALFTRGKGKRPESQFSFDRALSVQQIVAILIMQETKIKDGEMPSP